jgi:hypothetical protein
MEVWVLHGDISDYQQSPLAGYCEHGNELFQICPFCALLYQSTPFITPNKCTVLINTILKQHLLVYHASV